MQILARVLRGIWHPVNGGSVLDYGIYLAASGFLSQEKRLQVIANNLANANTAGYKGDIPVFRIPDSSQPGETGPEPLHRLMAVPRLETDFSQGPLVKTGNPLNVGIVGDGFFEVETPQGPRYTRKGDFTLLSDGSLVTQSGHPVMGQGGFIALTEGEIRIDEEGTLFVDGDEQGQLRVVTFAETDNLAKEGDALFVWTGDTSEVIASDRADVRQGYLESSNVNPVREMVEMISAIRTFEDHQKMIHAFDSAQKSAVSEIGRLR